MSTTDTTILMPKSAVPRYVAPNMGWDILIGFPKSCPGNGRLQTLVKQQVAIFGTSLNVDNDLRGLVVTDIVSTCSKEARRFVRYQTLVRDMKTFEWAWELSLAQAVAFTNLTLEPYLRKVALQTPRIRQVTPAAATGFPLDGANRPKGGPSEETGNLSDSSHSSVKDDEFPSLKLVSFDDWSESKVHRVELMARTI